MIVSGSTHVSANGPITQGSNRGLLHCRQIFYYLSYREVLIPLLAEQHSILYMYHILFIHSSIDGRSVCFHVLVIVNSAAMNTGGHGHISRVNHNLKRDSFFKNGDNGSSCN